MQNELRVSALVELIQQHSRLSITTTNRQDQTPCASASFRVQIYVRFVRFSFCGSTLRAMSLGQSPGKAPALAEDAAFWKEFSAKTPQERHSLLAPPAQLSSSSPALAKSTSVGASPTPSTTTVASSSSSSSSSSTASSSSSSSSAFGSSAVASAAVASKIWGGIPAAFRSRTWLLNEYCSKTDFACDESKLADGVLEEIDAEIETNNSLIAGLVMSQHTTTTTTPATASLPPSTTTTSLCDGKQLLDEQQKELIRNVLRIDAARYQRSAPLPGSVQLLARLITVTQTISTTLQVYQAVCQRMEVGKAAAAMRFETCRPRNRPSVLSKAETGSGTGRDKWAR